MRNVWKNNDNSTRLRGKEPGNWMYIWKSSDEISWKAVSFHHALGVHCLGSTDGLSKLFQEIKDKEKIADLSLEYQKFAEWLRIE